MLSGVLVLFGIISYQRIGMDRFPYIEFPVISVVTTQKGANPDVIDASITNLIETTVNSVPGIEHITSTSSPGVSQVNITFNLDKRVDVAFNEVQAKVNQVLRRLPKDADPPVVGPGADQEHAAWKAVQHGESTLAVVDAHPDRLRVVSLAAGAALLAEAERAGEAVMYFRRAVDLVIGPEFAEILRDRRRQRRLAVVHVPDRPHVHVRLRPLELALGHVEDSFGCCGVRISC